MSTIHTQHEHVAKQVHVLTMRDGIPYETELQICEACAKILAEKPLRRAAA